MFKRERKRESDEEKIMLNNVQIKDLQHRF